MRAVVSIAVQAPDPVSMAATITRVSDVVAEINRDTKSAELTITAVHERPLAVQKRGLSAEESVVAEAVGRGLTNKQIADVVGITEARVKSLVRCALLALGLPNRTSLAMWLTKKESHR
jgi:DNA-binding NarL/FixJ family response regulator